MFIHNGIPVTKNTLIQWDETITTTETRVIDEVEQTVEGTSTVYLQKWLYSMTDEEAYSHGYMRVEYLPVPDYDRLTHKYITGTLSDGSEIDGKWVVGGTIEETTEIEQAEIKNSKKASIKADMEAEANNGEFTSSLGFVINARRSSTKNDLQNIYSLIDLGVTEFMDADNIIRSVTANDLQMIKNEMQQYGLSLYQKKWNLQAQVDAATTQAELDAIVW